MDCPPVESVSCVTTATLFILLAAQFACIGCDAAACYHYCSSLYDGDVGCWLLLGSGLSTCGVSHLCDYDHTVRPPCRSARLHHRISRLPVTKTSANHRRCYRLYFYAFCRSEFLSNTAIRPFVCLSHGAAALCCRHAGCLQLSHQQPPDMYGLRNHPRTDIDPPRVELPSAGGGHIISPFPGR